MIGDLAAEAQVSNDPLKHLLVEAWTRLEGLTSEERANALQGLHQAVGKAVTYEAMALEFRTKAGQRFANGKDEEAKWWRALADEMAPRSKDYRDEQRHFNRQIDAMEDGRV